jgi:hypothetical protein
MDISSMLSNLFICKCCKTNMEPGEVSQILSDLKCPICSHYIRLSTNLSLVSKTSNNHWKVISLVFHGGFLSHGATPRSSKSLGPIEAIWSTTMIEVLRALVWSWNEEKTSIKSYITLNNAKWCSIMLYIYMYSYSIYIYMIYTTWYLIHVNKSNANII